ncbi:type II toxin-antitoxin system ParD family antitoxin [Pelomonas sp. KK5]|uniref:type II toxin-antitoxin system ParD family antitoxin n=1 Tax=Pelomonas sp. KK5 TaxID=1855730 RepID=UPI00097BEC49|nr:type II toxin-antitoxin system ParD family antitoxin [Pelomonas sp. KK5]
MPTRNVVLTDHQAELVDRLVSSGRYQNASEVLRDGLRLVERDASEAEARLHALREAARIGLADIKAGHYLEFDDDAALAEHLQALMDAALGAPKARRSR